MSRLRRAGEALFDLITARRGAALLSLAALLALCGYGATRLRLDEDLMGLIAGGGRVGARLAEAKAALDDFGALETLLIEVSPPGEVTPARLDAAAAAAARALEASGAFEAVMWRVERGGFEALFAHRFALLGPPTDFQAGVEALRRDLMMPLGAIEPLVTRDPAGQRHALIEALAAAGPRLRLDTRGGALRCEDQRHALLITQPKAKPLDRAAVAALLAIIQDAEATAGARLTPLGAHVFAQASAEGIRRDVWLTVSASLLGVLLLFTLALRRLAPALALLAPVGIGASVAVGLWGLLDAPLHGIILGFGAVMIGVSVDYGAHLVVHQAATPGDRRAAARAAYVDLLGGLLLGALTTLAGFAALLLSPLNALRAFAAFASVGVTAAFLAALLLAPLLLPLTPHRPASTRPPRRLPRAWALALTALLALAASAGLPRVRFSGDVRALDRQPPEIQAREATLNARYGLPRFRTLIVASGVDEAQALARAERATARLAQARDEGQIAYAYSPTALLPSPATQRARWAAFDEAAARRRWHQQAEAAGIEPSAFEPAWADLRAAQAAPPVTSADLQGSPAAPLLRRMIAARPGQARVMLIAYTDDPRRPALPPQLRSALSALPGVAVISEASLASAGVEAVMDGVAALSALSLALIAGLLALYYGRPRLALAALSPVLMAFLVTWGVMGWLEAPFNLVSVGAFALLAGVAVDYGIFMTDALRAGRQPQTRRAVGLAALTTLLGFASLLLARSPVMFSLGLAVSVGVLAALWTTHVALPAAWPWLRPRRPGRAPLWLWLLAAPLLLSALALLIAYLRGGGYQPARVGLILLADALTLFGLMAWMER
ncbi:MMPL family transporter [Myxococcota bacterium]|nr:MMPL family transporter [Myxococcota bacterium]